MKQTKPLDFTAHGGVWTPCAGSVTTWETHLGSEENEPEARCFEEDNCNWNSWPLNKVRPFLLFYGVYEPADGFNKAKAVAAGFFPHRYGYPWETVVHADFNETTTKLYTHGRLAYEMSYAMPDEKTVYGTDDGTNVMFSAFVSHKAKDMTEGIGYCAKYTQTSPAGCEAKDWTAHIEWIAMPEATAAQVEEAIDSTVFSDLFDVAECGAYGTCPGGVRAQRPVLRRG